MTILEKAEKACDFLRNNIDDNKVQEIQHHAGIFGQCMTSLGCHSSISSKFSALLQESIPVLLSLCSHQNSELRLVGDETLNRVVVAGQPYLASKVHLYLHNNIISTKDPRWLRAALSRICLGKSWLRAGGGRGRLFAQSTLQKLREILTRFGPTAVPPDPGAQLLLESLEANLSRIMKALAPYATKDEMFALLTGLVPFVDSQTASIRRSSATCIVELCNYHQKKFIAHILNSALDVLSSESSTHSAILGWFGVLRMLFSCNPVNALSEDIVTVEKCMQVFRVCIQHIESSTSDHNAQNASMECLNVLLSDPNPKFRSALLDPNGPVSLLSATADKHRGRCHRRSISSASMMHSVMSTASSAMNLSDDLLLSEQSDLLTFHGTLHLGNMSQQQTPYRSMEDLSTREMNTPDSPCESVINDMSTDKMMTPEQLSSYVNEKFTSSLAEESCEQQSHVEDSQDEVGNNSQQNNKINIGTLYDVDVPLKYCARLLVSRFLLSGYSGQIIPDKCVRVSVKASAICCMSCIVNVYPECLSLFLDKDVDVHNLTGNSDFSNMSHNERLNDFVLERNVCYQESMTDSFGQELLGKSIDMLSQVSNNSLISHKLSSSARREKYRVMTQESVDNSSLAGVPSNMLDSKMQSTAQNANQMGGSFMSADSTNLQMSASNFTMGSNMTASNDPLSTDFLMTTSIEPLTSSLDLEMKFDHFGESSSLEMPLNNNDIDGKIEEKFQDMFLRNDGNTVVERQISNESNRSNASRSDEGEDAKLSAKEAPIRKHSSERGVVNPEKVLETVEENSKADDEESSQSENENFESKKSTAPKIGVQSANDSSGVVSNEDPGPQHMTEMIFLLEEHPDPQIRGLIRICIGTFLNSVLGLSNGDYNRWKPLGTLSKEVADKMQLAKLVMIILNGLSDEIHSCVNNSLTALGKCIDTLSISSQHCVLPLILNSLRCVENNPYWLCKVTLCKLYEKLPFSSLCVIISDWNNRSTLILDIMLNFLGDQDQRVRRSATEAIAKFPPALFPPSLHDINKLITSLGSSHSETLLFVGPKADVDLLLDFRTAFVLSDLPGPLKFLQSGAENYEESHSTEREETLCNNLKSIIATLSFKLMESKCKNFTQGCVETLLELSMKYPPTKHPDAYIGLGLLDMALLLLETRTLPVSCCETLLAFLTQIYSIAAWNMVQSNVDTGPVVISATLKPPDSSKGEPQKLWQHLGNPLFIHKAESFLKITLKMLNIIIHIVEDVTPMAFHHRPTSIIPPSPIRRKSGEQGTKKLNTPSHVGDVPPLSEDKTTLRKKAPFNSTNGHFTPIGYFANDSILMKLYYNLRAAYSSHKVSLDSSTSIFLKFVSTTLNCIAIQLEFMSEKEAGLVAEEILYYIKCLLPMNPDNSVFCVTQMLKCLSSTNTIGYCNDLKKFFGKSNPCDSLSKWEKMNDRQKCDLSFYADILMAKNIEGSSGGGTFKEFNDKYSQSRRGSNESKKSSVDGCRLKSEKESFSNIIAFSKCKLDKRWNANKQDLGRYLRLIEPAVIQALKSYTIQNNIPLQCRVLEMLNQLLALRVNYFLLDSDQVFIGFVFKQLENIENHEILDCGDLVRCIFTFLVHLSSVKHHHHNKQLMDIPKLIQLCDGLMASGVHSECVQSLHPVSYRVFVSPGGGAGLQQLHGQGGPPHTPASRMAAQEAQVAKEVLFAMMLKILHDPKVIKLISSILLFSEDQPESHLRWSQLALDTVLLLLKQDSIAMDDMDSYVIVEKLFDCLHSDLIYQQGRLESILTIMLDKPPPQDSATMEWKQRWLATIVVFLRKVISRYAENEILLSLNYLRTSHVSPGSIFFNMENEIDPLNVQTVNENCASLSPDVIFVRFLFRVVSYALLELKNCERNDVKEKENGGKSNGHLTYWCSLTTSLLCQVKHILYLKDGCRFPLLAKTAQSVLQNEQSGLNTGLYSPEENIPLEELAEICNRLAWWQPLLTVHWCHLLLRLKFLEQKYWNSLFGFLQNSSMQTETNPQRNLNNEILQIGCFLSLCEYFVDNGLEEVIYLTWLLVNRVHLLVRYSQETIVGELIEKVNALPSASGLLLQAVAARCQHCLKGSFGVKVYKILSICHLSQTGPLILFICRIIDGLHPCNSYSFARLAVTRCRYLLSLGVDEINAQLAKEDVQMALEQLQQNHVHLRHPQLIQEVNILASTFFDLSPLDLSQGRPINSQYIKTTNIDTGWLVKQIKNRCYRNSNEPHVSGRLSSLAKLLQSLDAEQLDSIVNCPEFDSQILCQMLKSATLGYVRKLVEQAVEWDHSKRERNHTNFSNNPNYYTSYAMRNEVQSQFYVSIKDSADSEASPSRYGKLKLETNEDQMELVPPEFDPFLSVSLVHFERLIQGVVSLFPRQSRPLSQFDTGTFSDNHTMDKYTRRCFQVFRDKLFHKELLSIQNIVASYLESFKKLENILNHIDCDVKHKILDLYLPKHLAKTLMSFTIISLQYTSYLIKLNENDLPADCDTSFRGNGFKMCDESLDHTLNVTILNASKAFYMKPVWKQLNMETNMTRVQSAINCLYGYVRYIVKDSLPITLINLTSPAAPPGVPGELSATCDKFLTLIKYWEDHIYNKLSNNSDCIMSHRMQQAVEKLLVVLCRCDFACSFTLVPPLAWNEMDIFEDIAKFPTIHDLQNGSDAPSKADINKERRIKKEIPIPISSLQDMDVLEQFIFRVNLIGWTTKKGFEEIWMSLLSALQGNGTHWAVRGITQLLLSAHSIPTFCVSKPEGVRNLNPLPSIDMKRLKSVSLDCDLYETLFSEMDVESYAFSDPVYNYSSFSMEYLIHAAGINDNPDIRTQNALKECRKNLQDLGIDINSCLQLLMDIAAQVASPQCDWGLGGRLSMLWCAVSVCDTFSCLDQWRWLDQHLQTISANTEPRDHLMLQLLGQGMAKVKAIQGESYVDSAHVSLCFSSPWAPTRCSALHSAICHLRVYRDLHRKSVQGISLIEPDVMRSMAAHLEAILQESNQARVSLYERSLYWRALFIFVDLGYENLFAIAINYLLNNHTNFCFPLVLKGVCSAMINYRYTMNSNHKDALWKKVNSHPELCGVFLPLITVLIYSEAIPLVGDVLEPEQLLSSMQTAASLQTAAISSVMRHCRQTVSLLNDHVADFLTPHAIVHKVTMEFIDLCRWADQCSVDRSLSWSMPQIGLHLTSSYAQMMADIVFTVFETSIKQNQLPIVSGWLFDVLEHILPGKISVEMTPYCLLCLVVCSSDNPHIRAMAPVVFHTLKTGFHVKQRSTATMDNSQVSYGSEENSNSETSAVHSQELQSRHRRNVRLSFADKRILCLGAVHSGFTDVQIKKLKDLSREYEGLKDLLSCL